MPELTVNEFGRKPYISPGKGVDGGYVNAMRRTTQKSEFDNPVVALAKDNPRRGSIDQNDTRKVVTTPLGLVTEYISDAVIWGMTFDNSGGLYIAKSVGDILYRPAGSTVFGALGQASNPWDSMACSVAGDIYVVSSGDGIFIRAGGVGNFALFAAGWFASVESDPNGDVYALSGNYLWVRSPGAPSFVKVTEVTQRGYRDLGCAPNGDLYATAGDIVYVRTGRTGDLVELQTLSELYWLAAAPNGDVFLAPYTGYDLNLYKRTGGAGAFVAFYNVARPIQDMSVSPGGILYLSSTYWGDNRIYQLNTEVGIQPPVETIVQRHSAPINREQPLRKNLKPYANKSYSEMQQFARPNEYNGTERQPETIEAKPLLVDHIPEVTWFIRNGAPVVVDIPTTDKDPVSGVEIYARVDGFASVAQNGTSVIYNPGASGVALLIVHTKSGQQCSVNLMAK